MIVETIQLINFKNYSALELSLNAPVTCIVGDNGMGKTNLLDAVFYSCLSKSYFNAVEKQNIKTGEDFFTIKMSIKEAEKSHQIFCNYLNGEKKVIKKNNKAYKRVADHIGQFPCVMITPGDLYLINEYSEERRKFVDSIISQYDANYLNNLLQYHKTLSQRNALLKSTENGRPLDMDLIQVFDQQLNQYGQQIHQSRLEFITAFVPLVQSIYKDISSNREQVTCFYKSQLVDHNLLDLLAKDLDKDKIMGRTHAGIHKDDYQFLINDMPVKKYGSQGQQKSFVFALKLAQARLITLKTGKFPILLLDDIFDRLDLSRMKNLLGILFEHTFGHIFLSDTEEARVSQILKDFEINFEVLTIDNGNLASNEKA